MIFTYQAQNQEEISNFDKRLDKMIWWSKMVSLTTHKVYKQRGQIDSLIKNGDNFSTRIVDQQAYSKVGELLIEDYLRKNNLEIITPTDLNIYCKQDQYDFLLNINPKIKNILKLKPKSYYYDLVIKNFNIHVKVQDAKSRANLKTRSWIHNYGDLYLNNLKPKKDLTFLGYLDPTARLFVLEWILYTAQIVNKDTLLDEPLRNQYSSKKKAIYSENPEGYLRKNIMDEIKKGNITPLALSDIK